MPDTERRTLIACSGGADSCALALCLASAPGAALAHVVHDFRDPRTAMADHDAVRHLAAELKIPFLSATVSCRTQPGNLESVGRRLRYAALVDLARSQNCAYVATAHHADDQLETILMRLARGAGPAGLTGIAPRRRMAPGVHLIRPMLALSRDACRKLCLDAGWTWQEDATNADTSRVRAALRANVIPALKAIRPDIAPRASETAALQRSTSALLVDMAAGLWHMGSLSPQGASWPRALIRAEHSIVVGELLRLAHRRLAGSTRIDQLSANSLRPILRAVRENQGQNRSWTIGNLHVQLTRESLVLAESPA